ncbi:MULTISPECIES: ABC transporter ATP-binding protein [Roseiflexus]|uniref:ABC transporter related n=1 Tax=Roseiflexus castenholzii (strain DSM 13941 / HLO8) TaxID=383372 RepID=A7NMJ9_ROSCS|nr:MULTISPECIES: ABC transporter ATP-binding protein [Roseiflexus]ABU58770.1 ABC transporter related [Roseiflexus castenholzii DSM 13941]GIW01754.1 MAG: ABC transporter ATP-binding protein [Roseiflexus sp.]
MPDYVIETTGLRKVYGAKVAVADLTLQVPRGEVFAFLGPNGAGKSTAVKMLLGLVKPTEGDARVLGFAPADPRAMARIGFLPEHFRFHEWLQAHEFLDLHARLSSLPASVRQRRILEVLALVGLSEHAQRPLANFSKGMLQRIGLAQALIHEPELVFLDEPTSALDPFGRMLVRNIIRDLRAHGTTVFLNSHLLGEVELTCDRAAFIREGRVLRTLSLHDAAAGRVRVTLRVAGASNGLLTSLAALCANGSTPQETSPGMIELEVAGEDTLPQIAEHIVASGARLYALTPQRVSLEQLFLEIVGADDSGQ